MHVVAYMFVHEASSNVQCTTYMYEMYTVYIWIHALCKCVNAGQNYATKLLRRGLIKAISTVAKFFL